MTFRVGVPLLGLIGSCSAEPLRLEQPVTHAKATAASVDEPSARKLGATELNAECERCHTAVAEEWRGSLHQQAWTDPVFLGAYAIEPLPFCRGCHAPMADISNSNDPARFLGVGCVTCHLEGEHILGVRDLEARAGGHAVVGSAQFASASACESCHQFEFPIPQDASMQDTAREHEQSPQRDSSCQDCHMASPGQDPTRRSHRFQVHGDPARLRSSLEVSARLTSPRSLEVSLRTSAFVGHAVPTGDMFRRLEVQARALGESKESLEPVVLAREFRMQRKDQAMLRIQVGDSRVPANGEPKTVQLNFAHPVGEAGAEWRVVYRRMGPQEAALFGVDLAGEEVEIASGTLVGTDARLVRP